MTKKLVWRLGKLPSPDEVRELVKDKIITHDEARDILFSSEDQESDQKALQSEIEFLRKLVDQLAVSSKIVEVIKTIEKPFWKEKWYGPYQIWSSGGNYYSGQMQNSYITTATSNNVVATKVGSSNLALASKPAFSSIKTF